MRSLEIYQKIKIAFKERIIPRFHFDRRKNKSRFQYTIFHPIRMRSMNFVARPSCIPPFNYITEMHEETREEREIIKKGGRWGIAFVSQVSVGQGSVKATVLIVPIEKRCLVCTGKWIKLRFPSLGKRGGCKLRFETRNNSVENDTF